MSIITTRHGFQFNIEREGFLHAESSAEKGDYFVETELDRLSAATVARIYGESVARAAGQSVATPTLDRLNWRAEKAATKGWHKPEEAFFMISAWVGE